MVKINAWWEVRINAYLWEGDNSWEGNKGASWGAGDVLYLFFLV